MKKEKQNPTCHNCKLRELTKPKTEEHKKQPTYLECRGCGAIHLTYEPLEHQRHFHETDKQPRRNRTSNSTNPLTVKAHNDQDVLKRDRTAAVNQKLQQSRR